MFILLYKVVLSFKGDHCGAVYYAVRGSSNF